MSVDEKPVESSTPIINKTVGELELGSKEVNITVKVISKTAAREVSSKIDGSMHKVADVLVGDSTGCILMTLWDDNIDKVTENVTIAIKKGYVSLFKGSMRLNTGKYGTLEPAETAITEVKTESNLSDRRFEQEQRYPRFQPLYADRDRDSRGGRGGRGRFRRGR